MINQEINDCWNKIGVWGTEKPRCEHLKELTHCHNCKTYSQAGHALLSRPIDNDYLSEWENILSKPREKSATNLNSVLAFRMGDEWFALQSSLVREITHCDKHHSLPHRKSEVLRGLVNVRGELILNVSLGYLFKVSKSEINSKFTNERYIVIQDEQEQFAFPVTEVKEIIHYHENDIKKTPSTISKDKSCFVKGILKHKNIDIGLLDSDQVFLALHKNI